MIVPVPRNVTLLTTARHTYVTPGNTAQIEFNATKSSERTGFQLEFKTGMTKCSIFNTSYIMHRVLTGRNIFTI